MNNQKYIRIAASVIVACMFVIVPSDKMVNGHSFDFTYKFIWNLGVADGDAFPYVPNVDFLIAQIAGILAIVWLLTKNKE
ncbi:hypothetical protein GZZ85_05225 [Klebsiella aerogenes]|uniref:hypothetical protein n=1 Tax=Klebsiella aerogenes TaxID=548 RepID=UPI00190E74C5|nr:hypothetical protein [Klebsiella aerogenes]MBK0697117.1 hypothetical protein [Klebsiella aerogenes]